MFARIASVLDLYRPWTVLGNIDDLDAYVEAHVTEVVHYEANFRMLKVKKEAEKLPDFTQSIRISLAPFKATLEDQMQRLADTLLIALRRSVLDDFKDVDVFLNESMDTLSSRPTTIAEITKAEMDWKDIGAIQGERKKKSQSCLEKKKVLLQQAPGSAVDIRKL